MKVLLSRFVVLFSYNLREFKVLGILCSQIEKNCGRITGNIYDSPDEAINYVTLNFFLNFFKSPVLNERAAKIFFHVRF